MLIVRGGSGVTFPASREERYEASSYLPLLRFDWSVMTPLTDVPIIVVFLHFAALTVLLTNLAFTQFRRFLLVRQNRRNTPPTGWVRLLQVSLGLSE